MVAASEMDGGGAACGSGGSHVESSAVLGFAVGWRCRLKFHSMLKPILG